MKTILAAVALLAGAGAANAQIYEWTDADGNRVFSDRKPAGVPFEVRGTDPSRLSTYTPEPIPPSGAPEPEASADDRETGDRRRTATPAARKRERERRCNGYLADVDAIQERLRAGYDEPEGNRLRARRSALQAAYRRDCR